MQMIPDVLLEKQNLPTTLVISVGIVIAVLVVVNIILVVGCVFKKRAKRIKGKTFLLQKYPKPYRQICRCGHRNPLILTKFCT